MVQRLIALQGCSEKGGQRENEIDHAPAYAAFISKIKNGGWGKNQQQMHDPGYSRDYSCHVWWSFIL